MDSEKEEEEEEAMPTQSHGHTELATPTEPVFKKIQSHPWTLPKQEERKVQQRQKKKINRTWGSIWGENKEEEESAEKRGETLQNFKEGKERRAGCEMSNPENEKTSQINESFHLGQQPDPMKSAINPPPPMYGTSPSMPYQNQVYVGPPGAIPVQPQQTIPITNVQFVNEPDYLGYSIFTLLCCCLPLGIAALVFSIQTQGANQRGDIASAKTYSKVALILDHIAVGLGIVCIILAIILVIVPAWNV